MTGAELFSEERSAEVVAASFAGTPDPRLRQVLTSLVRHLHAFVKDVELTEEEWGAAIDFLTRTGQMCNDVRQEFILLSDVLGVSMLVETINHRTGGTSTESTVLGPFHMVESPAAGARRRHRARRQGHAVPGVGAGDRPGRRAAGRRVGRRLAGQRGRLLRRAAARRSSPRATCAGCSPPTSEGRFWFRSVVPRYYPIPDDGPVGQLLAATGRHPNRPAHLHFIVAAPGYRPVTTHVFVADSPYLDSDAVFGVKESLVRRGARGRRPGARRGGRACPTRSAR